MFAQDIRGCVKSCDIADAAGAPAAAVPTIALKALNKQNINP